MSSGRQQKKSSKIPIKLWLEWWVRYSDSRKHNGMDRMKSLRPKHLLLHLLIFSFSSKNNNIFWEILHFVQQNWRRPCCLPYWLSNREKKQTFFLWHNFSSSFSAVFTIFLHISPGKTKLSFSISCQHYNLKSWQAHDKVLCLKMLHI